MSIPTQTPAWEEQAPLLVDVSPVPAILSGVHEVKTYLRLTDDFLRIWMDKTTDRRGDTDTPCIPHFMVGQKACFPTRAVLAWLADLHGYGAGMADPAHKPKTKRKQPGLRPGDKGGRAA